MKRKNLIKYAKMAGFKNVEILLDSHNLSDILDVVRMECAAKIAKKINKQKVVTICNIINQGRAIGMNKDGVVFEQCTVNDILTLICYLTGELTYGHDFNMNTLSPCCELCAKKGYAVYLNVISAGDSSKLSKDIFRLTGRSCSMPMNMLNKKVLHVGFDQDVDGITVTIRISNNSVKSTYFVDKIIYHRDSVIPISDIIREGFTRCQEEVRGHCSKVKPIQVKSLLGGDDRDCIDSVIKSIEKKYPSDQIRGECTSMGRIWRLVETNAYSLTPKFTVNVTPENKNQNDVDQISHTVAVTNKGIFHIENCDYDVFKLHEYYRNDIQKIFKNSNDIYHVDANIKYGRQIEILMRDYFSVGTSTNAVDTGIIAAEIAICSAFLHALPAAAIEVILDDALYSEFKHIMQKLTLSMYDEKRRNYASTI